MDKKSQHKVQENQDKDKDKDQHNQDDSNKKAATPNVLRRRCRKCQIRCGDYKNGSCRYHCGDIIDKVWTCCQERSCTPENRMIDHKLTGCRTADEHVFYYIPTTPKRGFKYLDNEDSDAR